MSPQCVLASLSLPLQALRSSSMVFTMPNTVWCTAQESLGLPKHLLCIHQPAPGAMGLSP